MIKKILITVIIAALFFSGCKKDASVGPQAGRDDGAFNVYENSFLEGLWKLNPDWATSVGYHNTTACCLYQMTKAGIKWLTTPNYNSTR